MHKVNISIFFISVYIVLTDIANPPYSSPYATDLKYTRDKRIDQALISVLITKQTKCNNRPL